MRSTTIRASAARVSIIAAACGAWLAVFSSTSHAALIVASDNAADAAYNDNWQPGDNGGFGWGGGWTFRNQANAVMTTTNGNRGWFTGNSLNNNNPALSDSNGDGDVNTPTVGGRAWGVYSNTTDVVYAVRPLASPLTVGQKVTWYMDNGNVNTGNVLGVRLISNVNDPNGSRVFESRFVGGQSFYTLFDNANERNTALGFSREGVKVEYTLNTATTYTVKLTRLQSGQTETMTGTNIGANPITGIVFRNSTAGSGSAFDGFFNSISVTDPNNPVTVNDHMIFNVMANDPGNNPVTHNFTATNLDGDPLTWSGFTFGTYTPDYGGSGSGPVVAATFDTNMQVFSWNTTGSPRGIYTWNVNVSDGEASDTGTLTIHVTDVPEPATAAACVVAIAVGLAYRRRR
jgi:hypothetical protein